MVVVVVAGMEEGGGWGTVVGTGGSKSSAEEEGAGLVLLRLSSGVLGVSSKASSSRIRWRWNAASSSSPFSRSSSSSSSSIHWRFEDLISSFSTRGFFGLSPNAAPFPPSPSPSSRVGSARPASSNKDRI